MVRRETSDGRLAMLDVVGWMYPWDASSRRRLSRLKTKDRVNARVEGGGEDDYLVQVGSWDEIERQSRSEV